MIFEELENSERNSDPVHSPPANSRSKILTEEVFSLLSERLLFGIERRKIGEIVVRKEIETRIVQVPIPIRHEQLIVEQVSPEYKCLARIDLGQTTTFEGASKNATSDNLIPVKTEEDPISFELDWLDRRHIQTKVCGSVDSPKAASELLQAIASLPSHECGSVRIEIDLKNSQHQASYQALVNRYCQT